MIHLVGFGITKAGFVPKMTVYNVNEKKNNKAWLTLTKYLECLFPTGNIVSLKCLIPYQIFFS